MVSIGSTAHARGLVGAWLGLLLPCWRADVVCPPCATPHCATSRRKTGQFYRPEREFGAMFEQDNRGKRSITLDLATAAGAQLFHDLLERADVRPNSLLKPDWWCMESMPTTVASAYQAR